MWRGYKLISDDSHFEAKPDLWRGYVDPEFRKYVPEVVKLPTGGDAWKIWGVDTPTPLGLSVGAGYGFKNLKTSGFSYSDPQIAGVGDGRQRLKEMDRDGVDAEVIYGPVAGLSSRYGPTLPDEARIALARGYNDFLSKEYTAADPTRLLGLAGLPNTSLEANLAEMMRVKDMPGIYGVSLSMWPSGKGVPTPEDDIFWKAAIDNDVPLTTHFCFGGGMAAEEEAKVKGSYSESGLQFAYCPLNRLLTRVSAGAAGTVNVGFNVIQLITAGVLDRFPSLRIAFAEVGAAWVPPFAEAADSNYERHHYWAGVELPHPPSYYIKRNFLFGIQDDTLAVRRLVDEIGVDNITWGTDFPHVATDWPHTHRLLDRMFDGVPGEVTRKVVGGNLARHLRLDPDIVHAAAA